MFQSNERSDINITTLFGFTTRYKTVSFVGTVVISFPKSLSRFLPYFRLLKKNTFAGSPCNSPFFGTMLILNLKRTEK